MHRQIRPGLQISKALSPHRHTVSSSAHPGSGNGSGATTTLPFDFGPQKMRTLESLMHGTDGTRGCVVKVLVLNYWASNSAPNPTRV